MKLNRWYNFLLTILFWITWETYNALIDKYNLTDNQKILLNFCMLVVVIILISNSNNFFN